MAITDYSSLKTAVANWLHKSDLTSNIPDFIALGEWRIARDLRISPLLTSSTVTIAAAGSSVALPSGYIEMANARIDGGAELHYTTPDMIDRVSGGSTPWAYTIIGSNIEVAPSWTAGGDLELTYYKKQDALSDSTTTNWFTSNAPDILLYAALLEAAPFLIADERIPVWADFYKGSVDALNAQYGVVDPHKRMMANPIPLQSGNNQRNP